MLWLPLIWLCLFVLLVGCGLSLVAGLQRIGGESFRAPLSTFQVFWFGYAFALAFVQLYSLVLPIRVPALVVLSVVSLAGFYLSRDALLLRVRGLLARPHTLAALAIAAVLVALLVAPRAAGPVTWYDTHLYHLQVVKWARSFAAVPGIANLHYRLAYNNSIHVFAALTDVFWKGRASHITLGFLVCVLVLQLAWCVARARNAPARATAAFSLLVLPFPLARVWTREISSLSSDLALGVLGIATVLELVRLRPGTARRDLQLALVLALAAAATTTKLGGAALLVVSAGLALHALWAGGWSRRRCLGFASVPALLLLGYFARQVILSGWLLFPTPLGNLHLAWSFPEAETIDQFRWIQSWARITDRDPSWVLDHGFWHWFQHWFPRFAESQERFLLGAAALVAWGRLGTRHRLHAREPRGRAAVLAALLSLLLWFQGAPDLRFGAAFFWILLAALGAPLLGQALRERSGMALGLSLCAALTFWSGGFDLALPDPGRATSIARVKALTPLKKLEVSPGLTVFAPEHPELEDRCSDQELPCTPYPAQQRLRRSDQLGAGFLY
jgi:hypothetical protein